MAAYRPENARAALQTVVEGPCRSLPSTLTGAVGWWWGLSCTDGHGDLLPGAVMMGRCRGGCFAVKEEGGRGGGPKVYSREPASATIQSLISHSVPRSTTKLPIFAYLSSTFVVVKPLYLHTLLQLHTITMSAMTDNRQQVYVSDGYSEPMSAQHNFANNFDLNDPEQAMTAYQRYVRPNTNPTHRAVTN